jgi:hypothetical protein
MGFRPAPPHVLLIVAAWAVCLGDPGRAAAPQAPEAAAKPAAPSVVGRFAIHPDFDRLVLPWKQGAQEEARQSGTTLVLTLPGAGPVTAPGVAGRRVRHVAGGVGRASLDLAPGTRVKLWHLGDRLVVDVYDVPASPRASLSTPTHAREASAGTISAPARPQPGVEHGESRVAAVTRTPVHTISLVAAPVPAPPSGPPLPAPAPTPAPRSPVLSTPLAPQAAGPSGGPAVPPVPAISAQPAQAGATDNSAAPAASNQVAVALLPADDSLGGPAILVPAQYFVGAAAFRRGRAGAEAHLVFDVPLPLDLSQVKDDPVFGSLTEKLLPDGTDLHLRLPPDAQLRLLRRKDGWAVAVTRDTGKPRPLAAMAAQIGQGGLDFAAASPGRVVVLEDEITGGRLLVGTQLAVGQGVAQAHQTAEFALFPTWQGVAVQPVTDRLLLQQTASGFRQKAADGGVLHPLWPEAGSAPGHPGRAMTRLFDFPNLPPAGLHNRLAQALRDAAASPKLGRFAPRVRVAQAMLAQGMDLEARGALQAAVADDPGRRDDPLVQGLQAVAEYLSAAAGGRTLSAPGFDPARLGTSDEAIFWRSLLAPADPNVAAASAAMATVWPLLLDYPPYLRRLILSPVADLLESGHQEQALIALLAAFPDPSLDLARARQLRRQGAIDASLAVLDRIAARPDRLARARAREEAIETRLAANRLTDAAAADALSRLFYAWRDDQREVRLRLRVAELRARAGAWRQALDLLRETDGAFPAAHETVHAAQTALVAELLRGNTASRLSPLDLVALAEEASTLLTGSDDDARLAPILVDKLLALDLPARAEPVLRRLFARAADGPAKAELGVRLATLLADGGDLRSALEVLGPADDAGLDSALLLRRGLLRAKLLAGTGHADDALTLLAGLPGPDALGQRAALLEKAGDWAGAAAAIDGFRQGDGFGHLADQAQRELILHLARDEGEAGDMAALRRLRGQEGGRFASGPGADLFAVLTAEPVQAVSDLPRAGNELATMRVLPGDLGLQPRPIAAK